MATQRIQTLSPVSKIFKQPGFLILLLWIILTLINFDKAFHIDDTFHLEVSKSILANPSHPLSGKINWGDGNPAQISTGNQPPLLYLLIALVSRIFGTTEPSLHLLISLFTLTSLWFFYKIAQKLRSGNLKTLLTLFAFCPAFIINQNVMTDVPVMAFSLGAIYFLLKAGDTHKLCCYILSGLLLGFGLLTKYSLLPFLPVILLVMLIRRDYRILIILFIPATFLFLWNLWFYSEFGFVHLFSRSSGSIHIKDFWAFMICLGSIASFSVSFFAGLFPFSFIRKLIFVFLALFIISVVCFATGIFQQTGFDQYLRVLFAVNGLLVFISLVISEGALLNQNGSVSVFTSDRMILFILIISISTFLIIFAPFMATRHILLIIPFVLLLGDDLLKKSGVLVNRISLIITVLLGLLLGISDWQYAGYYRKMASTIVLPEGTTTWTAGHWGWQWYSKKAGMLQYAGDESRVKKGDYIIYPAHVHRQQFSSQLRMTIVEKRWEKASLLTLFSGCNHAGMYESYADKIPWNLSLNPIDTIYICRVQESTFR